MSAKNESLTEIKELKGKVAQARLPQDLQEKVIQMVDRLERRIRYGGEFSAQHERVELYLDWIISLPWLKRSQDILELDRAKQVLDKHHYGLSQVKDRILEYMAVLNLRSQKEIETKDSLFKLVRAPILCFVGLVGTGKTTIAFSIAEAMGREIIRIPFGGLGDPLDLRGQSRLRPDAEPGLVIKALRRAKVKNPVILLDEIDRVTDEGRASIMGVLVELLDPEQNMAFRDHFIDYPVDLSEVMFIATCNNTTTIATAVLDRLEPIQMPSYSDEEKITIGKNHVLPQALVETGLDKDTVIIDPRLWPKIVRPLGFDAGIRTLGRNIKGICRKVARLVVEGKGKKFHLTENNIKEFLPGW